jgi:LacI family transcriptional regulator
MPVSLREVAQKSQTSVSTVSRILNGRKDTGVSISDKTRRRVARVARELGYQPNRVARSLRSGKTMSIGVIAPSGDSRIREKITGIEAAATNAGYEVMVAFSRWEARKQEHELQRMLQRRVDGILLLSPANDSNRHDLLGNLLSRGFPILGVGPTSIAGLSCVDFDRVGGFRQLATHLLEQGARRLAFVATNRTLGVERRMEGIRQAMESYSKASLQLIDCDRNDQRVDFDRLHRRIIHVLGKTPLDAVLAQTDLLAMLAMNAAGETGLKVPDDLAVSGCGNEAAGRWQRVPLTTLDVPYEKVARLAVEKLIARIEDKPDDNTKIVVPTEPVIRASSCFRRREKVT